MAEHDDLVRQAAEAVAENVAYWEDKQAQNPPEVFDQIKDLLGPFIAAARKEAREGALEEAMRVICLGCRNGWPLIHDDLHATRYPDDKAWRSRGHCAASAIRTLRSKPKEPA